MSKGYLSELEDDLETSEGAHGSGAEEDAIVPDATEETSPDHVAAEKLLFMTHSSIDPATNHRLTEVASLTRMNSFRHLYNFYLLRKEVPFRKGALNFCLKLELSNPIARTNKSPIAFAQRRRSPVDMLRLAVKGTLEQSADFRIQQCVRCANVGYW